MRLAQEQDFEDTLAVALADQHEPQGLAVIARSSHKRRGFTVARCAALGASPQAEGDFRLHSTGQPCRSGPRNGRGCRAEPVIHDLADAGRRMQLFRVL
jgi:hypothetical protein